jgi:hypothetical protein
VTRAVTHPLTGPLFHTPTHIFRLVALTVVIRVKLSHKFSGDIVCPNPQLHIAVMLILLAFFFFLVAPTVGSLLPLLEHRAEFPQFLDEGQSVGLLGRVFSSSQGLYLYTNTEKRAHTHTQILNIHALSGIRTHCLGFRASEDSARPRPLGYRDRHYWRQEIKIHESGRHLLTR